MSCEKLIVFVRAPLLGRVKTRLAASVGPGAALAAYQQLVEAVLTRVSPCASVELRYTPDDAGPAIGPWLRPGWTSQPQLAGDLGQRMERAFGDAFAGGAGRVALIGSDCPALTLQDIQTAWARLADHDLVLGPAKDGGYWLIALRQPQPRLFHGITWSTGSVFHDTLARAQSARLRAFRLRELADIDTAADWHEFARGSRNRGL